jgi:hypothetical protein
VSLATSTGALFAQGNLVRARGREWIVLRGSTGHVFRLRPLSGSEEDVALVHLALEPDVHPATFPPPTAAAPASQEAALLLRDALLMSLRRGAGPFRRRMMRMGTLAAPLNSAGSAHSMAA